MINHTVLFKLKEFVSEDQKGAIRSKIAHELLALKEKVGVLKYIEVGQNLELNTASFDVCLVTHFETVNDLDIYRVHPDHLKVFELIKANTISRAVVDYEF